MNLVDKIAYYFSRSNRHYKWDLFTSNFTFGSSTKILDVGFSNQEYSDHDNYLEKYYPYPQNITALGVDDAHDFSKRYPEVTAIKYDGFDFPFLDNSFDICWSNAVIEHVGGYDRQVHFLKEIYRVSKAFWVTTPNAFFPIEVHSRVPLLHFLPKPIFDSFLTFIGKGWAAGNYMNLISQRQLKQMISEASISEHLIYKNKLFLFTLEFIIKGRKLP